MRRRNKLLLTLGQFLSVWRLSSALVFRAGHEDAWECTLCSDLATELSGQITLLKVSTSSKTYQKRGPQKISFLGQGGKFGDFYEICGIVRNRNELTCSISAS